MGGGSRSTNPYSRPMQVFWLQQSAVFIGGSLGVHIVLTDLFCLRPLACALFPRRVLIRERVPTKRFHRAGLGWL